MPAGDVYKPRMGWRISQLILGAAFSATICGLPFGIWWLLRGLLEAVTVLPDRVVRSPFSGVFRRSYPLAPTTQVGLCEVFFEADHDEFGQTETDEQWSHYLVLHTPGHELLAFKVDGWPDRRGLAASIAARTGAPIQRVRGKTRLLRGPQFEFLPD